MCRSHLVFVCQHLQKCRVRIECMWLANETDSYKIRDYKQCFSQIKKKGGSKVEILNTPKGHNKFICPYKRGKATMHD